MEKQNVYQYILSEESSYQTTGVPITDGYEWKMFEHIRLSTLRRDSKFATGADDGTRPYKNIIRPIRNVTLRSEGFDVKDIEAYVNDSDNYYKSFLVRKFHDKWARKNKIDTAIDDSVESHYDFGGILAKNVNDIKPEIVPLQRIAFCDQTDILSGPICEKHAYSPDQLLDFKGVWEDDKIDELIMLSKAEKQNSQDSGGLKAKTPGRYIEVYELHGMLPEDWLNENGDPDKYIRQLQIVAFYRKEEGGNDEKYGITLYKGKERDGRYKFLPRDKIYGRALGWGGIEELFEAQVWTNYDEIQIKEMLDVASLMILQSADPAFAEKNNVNDLVKGEIIKIKPDMPITQVQITPINMAMFDRKLNEWEVHARTTGSANDAQLGISPTSGTPFALENLVTQTGQGIHEYRRGQIASFWEEIYRDWVIPNLVKEMNKGDKWLEELDLEELQYIADNISTKESNAKAVDMAIKYFDKEGEAPTQEVIDAYKETIKKSWMKGGNKRFLEIVKDEISKIPVDVSINVAGKQKDLGKLASGLTNIFRQIFAAPQVLQDPGMSKLFNEIVEASGFSPVNFQGLEVVPAKQMQQPQMANNQLITQ